MYSRNFAAASAHDQPNIGSGVRRIVDEIGHPVAHELRPEAREIDGRWLSVLSLIVGELHADIRTNSRAVPRRGILDMQAGDENMEPVPRHSGAPVVGRRS